MVVLFLLNGQIIEAGWLSIGLRYRWLLFLTLVMLIGIGIILPEEIGNKPIIVDDGSALVSGGGIKLPEETIHGLGVELEVPLHFLHPRLVHAVEVILYDVSDLEIDQRVFIVQVDLDDVCDE